MSYLSELDMLAQLGEVSEFRQDSSPLSGFTVQVLPFDLYKKPSTKLLYGTTELLTWFSQYLYAQELKESMI